MGMAATNALGEKLPMFVIGKSAKPQHFSGVRNIPCRYRAQKKAGWIASFLRGGLENWTASLKKKAEKLCLLWTTVQLTHM